MVAWVLAAVAYVVTGIFCGCIYVIYNSEAWNDGDRSAGCSHDVVLENATLLIILWPILAPIYGTVWLVGRIFDKITE